MGERRLGKGGGRERGAVGAVAFVVAEKLFAHDAIVVERDVGEHRAARHVAHRPDVVFALHAQMVVNEDEAARVGFDARVCQAQSLRVRHAAYAHQHRVGGKFALRGDDAGVRRIVAERFNFHALQHLDAFAV